MTEDLTIPSAVPFQINSMVDLVRLAITWASNQRAINLFYFKNNKNHILGAIQLIPGYFNLEGLPIFAYVKLPNKPEGTFIRYRLDPKEEWEWCQDAADRKYQHVPVISLKEAPSIFKNIE